MKKLLLAIVTASLWCGCTRHDRTLTTQQIVADADTSALTMLLDSANALFDRAEFGQSLVLAQQCAEVALALNDSARWAESLSCVLCDYQQMGMSDSAIVTSKQLLEIDKQQGDISMLASDYNNLAAIYLANKEYENARDFISLAIEAERQVEGQPKMSIRYGIASEIYNKLGEHEKALSYIGQAYELDSVAGRPVLMGRRLSQQGDIYQTMHEMRAAERCYLRATAMLEEAGERHSLGITYRQLGSLYLEQKERQKAIGYLEKAREITEASNELHTLVATYEKLSAAYTTVDDTKSNDYLRKYTQVKDSLLTLEKSRALAEFQVRYKMEEERARAAEKERLLRFTQQWGSLGLGLLVALALLLAVLLYRRAERTRQLHQRVQELQQELTDQRDRFLAMMHQESKALPDATAQDKELMDKINSAIFDLMGRAELTAENIASKLCITSQQLRRRLLAIKGVTSATYINSIRMGYAKQLLIEKRGLSITEISQLCGFEDPGHFTRAFKKETGVTPSQFRGN